MTSYDGSHDNMCGVPNAGACFVPWCTCPCHRERCGAQKPQRTLDFFHRPGIDHRCVSPVDHAEVRHTCECGETWATDETRVVS